MTRSLSCRVEVGAGELVNAVLIYFTRNDSNGTPKITTEGRLGARIEALLI